MLEKRDSNNWSGRISYTLANSRGNTNGAVTATNQLPAADRLQSRSGTRTDRLRPPAQPRAQRPRREVPHTHGMTLSATLRVLSGTAVHPHRHQHRSRSKRPPVRSAPGRHVQRQRPERHHRRQQGRAQRRLRSRVSRSSTTRVGWRFKPGQGRTIDLTADVINLTNHANFVNPTGDRRSTNFLLLTTLYGGGQPRQAQVGVRFGF